MNQDRVWACCGERLVDGDQMRPGSAVIVRDALITDIGPARSVRKCRGCPGRTSSAWGRCWMAPHRTGATAGRARTRRRCAQALWGCWGEHRVRLLPDTDEPWGINRKEKARD